VPVLIDAGRKAAGPAEVHGRAALLGSALVRELVTRCSDSELVVAVFVNGGQLRDRAAQKDPITEAAELYVMQALSGG
jgi:hypothetical protein